MFLFYITGGCMCIEEVSISPEILEKAEASETRSRVEFNELCEYQKILAAIYNAKGGKYGKRNAL
jgi:hypothetical protein